jgi:hypothetical protein
MVSGGCFSQNPLFESVNLLQALKDYENSILHTMNDDVSFEMTVRVANAAIRTKTSRS